jgi:hypothetical protein
MCGHDRQAYEAGDERERERERERESLDEASVRHVRVSQRVSKRALKYHKTSPLSLYW